MKKLFCVFFCSSQKMMSEKIKYYLWFKYYSWWYLIISSYHNPILFLIIKIHSAPVAMAACLPWTTNSSTSAMKDAADLKVFILRIGRKIYNILLHKCLINTWNCFPIFGKSFALRVLGTESFDLAFIFLSL